MFWEGGLYLYSTMGLDLEAGGCRRTETGKDWQHKGHSWNVTAQQRDSTDWLLLRRQQPPWHSSGTGGDTS